MKRRNASISYDLAVNVCVCAVFPLQAEQGNHTICLFPATSIQHVNFVTTFHIFTHKHFCKSLFYSSFIFASANHQKDFRRWTHCFKQTVHKFEYKKSSTCNLNNELLYKLIKINDKRETNTILCEKRNKRIIHATSIDVDAEDLETETFDFRTFFSILKFTRGKCGR